MHPEQYERARRRRNFDKLHELAGLEPPATASALFEKLGLNHAEGWRLANSDDFESDLSELL